MSKNKPTGFLRRFRTNKSKMYEGPRISKEERLLKAKFADMKAMDLETEFKIERTR